MNENEYYSQLLLWAKSQRTAFINSEKYGFFSIQIILQLLNLMENRLRVIDLELECYKANAELISLYKDYLDLHEENFKSQETEQLKNSLDKSIYATIVPELISFEIKNLIPNKKESFLLLPLSIAFYDLSESTWNFHEISCKIQNKNGFFYST